MVAQLVAGIDSSTQQTKLVIVDAATGDLARSSAVPHPDGTEIDPEHWWSALHGAGATRPAGARAISVTAQQHSAIFLDGAGDPVRNAILWNDLRATAAADALCSELGKDTWLRRVGFLPDAAHPVSKLRWLAENEPSIAERVDSVLLPHDWLTWRMLRRAHPATTDRSDASATGYWSAESGEYALDLVERALGHAIRPPAVLAPDSAAGTMRDGVVVGAGCGDNAATHLGLDTRPGDVVISIGTSTTVSMRTTIPTRDPDGLIDTMADARSGFLSIIVMLNGARVLAATARMLGVSLERLDALAASAAPDADGVLFVPYLDGERNPRASSPRGSFSGLSRHSMTPPTIARATILGLACAIVDALDALVRVHSEPARILIVGGGARSEVLRQAITDLAGRPTTCPEHREHAAFGAARQAAWALTGALPQWRLRPNQEASPTARRTWVHDVRAAYRSLVAAN